MGNFNYLDSCDGDCARCEWDGECPMEEDEDEYEDL